MHSTTQDKLLESLVRNFFNSSGRKTIPELNEVITRATSRDSKLKTSCTPVHIAQLIILGAKIRRINYGNDGGNTYVHEVHYGDRTFMSVSTQRNEDLEGIANKYSNSSFVNS